MDPDTQRLLQQVHDLTFSLNEIVRRLHQHEMDDARKHAQIDSAYAILNRAIDDLQREMGRRLSELEDDAEDTDQREMTELRHALEKLAAEKRELEGQARAHAQSTVQQVIDAALAKREQDDELVKKERRRAWLRIVGSAFLGVLAAAGLAALRSCVH